MEQRWPCSESNLLGDVPGKNSTSFTSESVIIIAYLIMLVLHSTVVGLGMV